MNEPAPITLPGRVVVFDYGEVISLEPSRANRAELLEIADPADAEGFWRAYWEHRHDLDRGTVSIIDYWRRVGATIRATWDDGRIHRMWACDFAGWVSVNPDTITVIEDLVAGATRVALLSNAGPDFSSVFRSGSFAHLFERAFVSGELKLLKPEAAIYRHVLDELGIRADQLVFVDNRADNVEGARALGASGHVFTSAADLRSYLVSLA